MIFWGKNLGMFEVFKFEFVVICIVDKSVDRAFLWGGENVVFISASAGSQKVSDVCFQILL